MDPLERRRLGRTDVDVTALGFGGAPLGDLFTVLSDDVAEATIVAAWDAGIRYFDTSPWYGRGGSEHRLGRVLRRHAREDVRISTKVGRVFKAPLDPAAGARRRAVEGWAGGLEFVHRWDYTYDGVMRSYEDSLQRLGMTRIDALLIHDLDRLSHATDDLVDGHFGNLVSGGFRALAELREAGLIGALGAGVNLLGTIPRFLASMDLDFFLVAMPYTLADQSVLDDEFPLCAERGVTVVIGAVFASGILATGPVDGATYAYAEATPEVRAHVAAIEAVCRAHDVPMAAAALQFPLHHPVVASVIPGALSPEHVQRNVAALQLDIPSALWADLKREGLLHPEAPTA
jgi:D-threo-aldose 1-dehydrogenase